MAQHPLNSSAPAIVGEPLRSHVGAPEVSHGRSQRQACDLGCGKFLSSSPERGSDLGRLRSVASRCVDDFGGETEVCAHVFGAIDNDCCGLAPDAGRSGDRAGVAA